MLAVCLPPQPPNPQHGSGLTWVLQAVDSALVPIQHFWQGKVDGKAPPSFPPGVAAGPRAKALTPRLYGGFPPCIGLMEQQVALQLQGADLEEEGGEGALGNLPKAAAE